MSAPSRRCQQLLELVRPGYFAKLAEIDHWLAELQGDNPGEQLFREFLEFHRKKLVRAEYEFALKLLLQKERGHAG